MRITRQRKRRTQPGPRLVGSVLSAAGRGAAPRGAAALQPASMIRPAALARRLDSGSSWIHLREYPLDLCDSEAKGFIMMLSLPDARTNLARTGLCANKQT